MKRQPVTSLTMGTKVSVRGRLADVTKADLDRWCAALWPPPRVELEPEPESVAEIGARP